MARTKRNSRWREVLKDLLSMHRDERRGVSVLIVLLLLLAGWVYYEQWGRAPKEHDLTALNSRMEAWVAEFEAQRPDTTPLQLFPFDPNTIGREEWRALGLSDRQVDGIERYLQKGGEFRTKKDLGRMYSLKPELVERLLPFVLLPDSLPKRTYPKKEYADRYPRPSNDGGSSEQIERTAYVPKKWQVVEVNTADTTELITLPFIGPAFARGIVKYRGSLGGFRSLDQLAEVYVLRDKPDALLKLKELLTLDTMAVVRIPINTCTVEELAAHPYARWRVAKPLIAYRTQHGPFKRVEDIRGCPLVVDSVFRKLAPYLSVE